MLGSTLRSVLWGGHVVHLDPSRVATIATRGLTGRNIAFEGEPSSMSLGQELAPHLPFLRRYARALTGSQTHGDAFVRATLEAIVAKPDEFPRDVDPRLGLYKTFHAIWSTANIEEGEEPPRGSGGPESIAHARLSRITPLSRQALLLTSLEGFSSEDAGYLIGARLGRSRVDCARAAVADHAAVAPGAAADLARRLFVGRHRLPDRGAAGRRRLAGRGGPRGDRAPDAGRRADHRG